MTVPTPSSSYASSATPRIVPALVAVIAAPGIDDEVSTSPGLIEPFSFVTFTGTRPDKATGTPFAPCSPVLPMTNAGLVETTPRAFRSYAPELFRTPLRNVGSILTTSPMLMVTSLVGYISAKSPASFTSYRVSDMLSATHEAPVWTVEVASTHTSYSNVPPALVLESTKAA